MSLILGANQLTAGGYEVDNSLRFNSASNDYLSRTNGTPTNNKILTFSAWIKRSNITTYMDLFDQDGGGSDYGQLQLTNADAFVIYQRTSGSTDLHLQTTQLFRDVSAWYHLVVAYDTTQATASNRIKLYVNGTQVTSFSIETYPSQNLVIRQNTASLGITVGNYSSGSNQYAGYMAEVYMIDGQALTPSDFGETDADTNIWKPIPYTGTFGTNGFYLKFANSSALGTDSSGNGNNFTVNNLTSVDQSTDTPTNNFSTMNSLSSVSVTLTEGNLKGAGAGDQNFRSTFAVNKGKWYWEVKLGADGGVWGICSENVTMATDRSSNAGVYGIQNAGGSFAYFRNNGSTGESAGFPNPVSGNIMNMAFDADNAKLYIGINGTYYNLSGSTGNPATGSNATYSSIDTTLLWLAFCEFRGAGQSCELNFGSPPFTISSGNADADGFGNFEYAVPSGYFALCTKNLAEYG
jgi:hypothetical protein